MVGGSGAGGDSFYDATSGTNRGPGSPGAGRRSDVGARVDGETGRARLWFALALLAVIAALGVIAVL